MMIRTLAAALAYLPIALPFAALAQGPLNPPGPPAPTMKSLDEIGAKLDQTEAKTEKRIPISSLPFAITAPGSYYLTSNLTGTAGQDGIAANADDVTIDLNGFKLLGPGTTGIAADARARIRNGTISGWSQNAIVAGGEAVIENVMASNNANRGISVGSNSRVESCTVTNSGTGPSGRGISVGSGSLVSKCLVTGTSGTNGAAIRAETGCSVIDSVARDNDATNGFAILVGTASSIIRCEASLNTGTGAAINVGMDGKVLDCVASSNGGANNDGILAAARALINGCTASANGGDGINVTTRCVVSNNLVTENSGDGIEVAGPYNRIDANHAVGNAAGFRVNASNSATSNLVLRNSAGANGDNYLVNPGNLVGGAPVSAATSGSNTNPHANYILD